MEGSSRSDFGSRGVAKGGARPRDLAVTRKALVAYPSGRRTMAKKEPKKKEERPELAIDGELTEEELESIVGGSRHGDGDDHRKHRGCDLAGNRTVWPTDH